MAHRFSVGDRVRALRLHGDVEATVTAVHNYGGEVWYDLDYMQRHTTHLHQNWVKPLEQREVLNGAGQLRHDERSEEGVSNAGATTATADTAEV